MPEPLRLAVLGAGPKALFALEELCAQLDRCAPHASAPLLEVTVIEAGTHAGAGAAYLPDQPAELRLNVTATILDAPAAGSFPSFPDWTAAREPALVGEPYPPRAVVGRYLVERWRAMLDALGRWAISCPVRGRAVAVHRSGEQWRVDVDPGGPLAAFDEVLVATGHGAGHDGALAATWSGPLPLRPAVLPVGTMLDEDRVPPGSRVAVRGGALTFLDAALALTEGRGAAFTDDPAGSGRLRHHRSPREPAVILPTARHGLLLDAKPDPGTPAAAADAPELAAGARRLAALDPADPEVVRRMLDVLTRTAAQLLTGRGASDGAVLRAVEGTLASGRESEAETAEQTLRRSADVALGRRDPGPAWALGRAWSVLYPQITRLLRGSALPPARWAELRRAAQVLERFAFGPPLISVRKLLAMIDSGAVDLCWVDAGTRITPHGIEQVPEHSAPADVVVDAVLAPPGLVSLTDPLARALLEGGLAAVRPGRRGAMVAEDATALTTTGERTEHLALIGRPTEDHVIGHDTLNRHLHHEIRHWAARVAARAVPPEESPHENRP